MRGHGAGPGLRSPSHLGERATSERAPITEPTAQRADSITASAQRLAGRVKLVSLLVIVASVLLLARALQLQDGIGALATWVERLGAWGPVAFGLLYVLATLLFLPGLILTLAAGALFGLPLGFVTVSLASTAGAGCAFAIGRHLARSRVERVVRSRPRLAALDAAVAEGGWKIVALMRLSPAVPFNLQNYLFGLTPVGSVAYLLTSWIAMMPGTFLYVYLGHLAGAAVVADRARTPAEWAMLALGLVATVAVTLYVTVLARRQLAERGALVKPEAAVAATPSAPSTPTRWPWGATTTAAAALLLASLATWSCVDPAGLRSLLPLGPPRVQMSESYSPRPGGPRFDHSAFDRLLRAHVDPDGWVDHRTLAGERATLQRYLAAVAEAPFDALGRDEKLALLINAYNAATLELILEHFPLDSIRDIPAAERWKAERWVVGGRTLSLDQIEHQEIRPHFIEPRIHFVLVCAAVGCPPLRSEAFTGRQLEQQLEEQTRYVHRHATWARWEPDADTLWLTPLYQWYAGDFEQGAGSVTAFAARYLSGLEPEAEPTVRWLDYDWSLNDVANRRPR